jgi:hypothetical protein
VNDFLEQKKLKLLSRHQEETREQDENSTNSSKTLIQNEAGFGDFQQQQQRQHPFHSHSALSPSSPQAFRSLFTGDIRIFF